ncbi:MULTISPECIES: hypothetical protein [unclassified Acidovorax]|uniref:hypothetical protein n=1 Tax=unclassified Acidovorax TaxID=2684926 RepID=UPI000ADD451B|nr:MULTISPECIES: hypothetical protein [unclassified Acidovorax]MBD9391786.1 hypothetical protein [Acidovorax sp. ACV01]
MRPHTLAMVLTGAGNLLLAGVWMFGALLGANGMNSSQGGRFLGAIALSLALLWAGSLVLARRLTAWGLARGWSTGVCVVLATVLAVVAWAALAFVATVVVAIALT